MRRVLILVMALMLALVACSDSSDDAADTTSAADDTATTQATDGTDATEAPDSTEAPDEGDTDTTAAAADPGRDDLVISLEGEPPTLDVSTTASTFSVQVLMYNVLETMVRLNPETGEVLPGLAESWEVSDDGTVYTFTLRPGATFSTGEPVTASDVVFSYETMSAEGSPHAAAFAAMESVEAIDDSTVQVTLTRRSNTWLQAMAKRVGLIFSEAHYGEIAENPIGSGPFMVESWTRGDRITLVRNPEFDGEPATLASAEYTFITDEGAAINALLAGDVDVLSNLLARDRASELESAGFGVYGDPTPRVHGLFFRVDQPLADDLLVRQAVSHAVDKQGLVDALGGGYGTPVGSWVSTGDPWYEDFDLYPYDVEQAKALLAEAGYPDGIDLEMTVISENISGSQGELVALMLAEAGINVDLQFVDVAVFLDEVIGQGRFVSGIVASVGSIDRFTDGDGWFTGWNSEEFNQLLADADAAETTEEQNDLMAQANQLLAEELPVVTMYNDVDLTVERAGLQGWSRIRVDQGMDLYPVTWSE